MTSRLRALGLTFALTILTVGVAAPPAVGAPLVRNGDFETGDDARWQVSVLGSGTWMVYDDPSLVEGRAIDPPHGQYAIATSQPSSGSRVLSQVARLPKEGRLELRFVLWYLSQAPITVADTLRHDADVDNQQFRMDVIKPGANVRTLKPEAILMTVFRTRVGDPESLTRTTITKRLTSLAGQRVRLRFAEVDNLDNFTVVVDRVRIVVS